MSNPPHSDYSDRKRVEDLERVLEVARHLGATVELDPLLQAIAAAATAVLDCERASVFLYDRNSEELYSRVATGMSDSAIKEIRFPVSRGIAGEVARTNSVINLPDVYADPRFNPDFDRQTGFRTRNMLAFPLAGHDNTTVGVLQVLNKRGGPFGDRDEQLVRFLGAQAGVAIQRQMLLEHFAEKQRIQRDLNIAREIQQGLLPREQPVAAGFDVAGWNRPADETGGDCFDFMPVGGDGALAITIADATGHGIGPALVIAETRALFRATISQTQDLTRVVEQVNALLCDDLPDDKFVTAFFGLLSPRDQLVRFISAGHGPLLAYSAAKDEVREMQPHGLPLGIMPDGGYSTPELLEMQPGDMLVLFTDGFFEWARPDGEQFGTDRLFDLIRQHRAKPAADLITMVYQSVIAFSEGASQADDLTAVVVKKL